MEAKTEDIKPEDMYKLLIGSVLPRPIAWIGSRDLNGVDNLAPFSFFNVASTMPPVISVSISRKTDGSQKDSYNNIMQTKDFSVSIVDHEQAMVMHETATMVAPNIDEFEHFGIEKSECTYIAAAKVKRAKVTYECRFRQIVEFGDDASNALILGDVLSIYIDDDIINYPKIDMQKLDAVGRGAGPYYITTRDNFSMLRK